MKKINTLVTLTSIALLSAACSSGGGVYSAEKPKKPSAAWKTVQTSKGQIFTDQAGKSLYTFDKDSAGVPTCYGDCAVTWPAFTAASNATTQGKWTVVSRNDGTKQWALNGKPLYYFAGDNAAGDVRGDGIQNVWHVAKKTGAAKTTSASYSSTSSSYSDGY